MKDLEPNQSSKDPNEFKNPLKEIRHGDEFAEFLRDHRFTRKIFNWAVILKVYTYLVVTPTGRVILRDSEARRFYFNREPRIGMLEDSIFNHELYYPNQDGTSLDYKSAVAGRWVSYDFHRLQELGAEARQIGEGRIFAFMLEEIEDREPDDYTPTGLVNWFDFDHMLHLETPSIDDLIKQGFVRETTYRRAFSKVGAYEKYSSYLALAAITENPLYMVTPKGNGLISLIRDTGSKVEKPKGLEVLKPVMGF